MGTLIDIILVLFLVGVLLTLGVLLLQHTRLIGWIFFAGIILAGCALFPQGLAYVTAHCGSWKIAVALMIIFSLLLVLVAAVLAVVMIGRGNETEDCASTP